MDQPTVLLTGAKNIIVLCCRCHRVIVWIKLYYSSCIREQRVLNWSVPFPVPITDKVCFKIPNLVNQKCQDELFRNLYKRASYRRQKNIICSYDGPDSEITTMANLRCNIN